MLEDATQAIPKAYGAGRLGAYFQPIVDAATERPMGVEALATVSPTGAQGWVLSITRSPREVWHVGKRATPCCCPRTEEASQTSDLDVANPCARVGYWIVNDVPVTVEPPKVT